MPSMSALFLAKRVEHDFDDLFCISTLYTFHVDAPCVFDSDQCKVNKDTWIVGSRNGDGIPGLFQMRYLLGFPPCLFQVFEPRVLSTHGKSIAS